VVITMGCGNAGPIFPGMPYLDWELEDPAGPGVETVRLICDEIKGRVQTLLVELLPNQNPAPGSGHSPSCAAPGSRSLLFPHLRLEPQLPSADLAAGITSGTVWLLASFF
jgi:hypothetical protein